MGRFRLILALGSFLAFLAAILPPSHGLIGYDIVATVDSNKWEIHRSTQAMYFNLNSTSAGSGSFSKYQRINRLDGMNSGESSYSLNGSVNYKEGLYLRAVEGPVTVKTKFEDIEITDPNETTIDLSTGNIEIREQWPTYVASYKWVRYTGRKISVRDYYENNGDIVHSSIQAKSLNKENFFKAYINRTVITVNLTPTVVKETRFANKSSEYTLLVKAKGTSTHLDLMQNKFFSESEPFGRPDTVSLVSQDYVGDHNISIKAKMEQSIILPEEPDSWLQCCRDYIEEINRSSGILPEVSAETIFNASAFNASTFNAPAAETVKEKSLNGTVSTSNKISGLFPALLPKRQAVTAANTEPLNSKASTNKTTSKLFPALSPKRQAL